MKNITIILLTLFFVFTHVTASVKVNKDSVTFSITANTVSKVEVVFKGLAGSSGSDTIPLMKGTNNIWSKTIKMPAGFYYYLFRVDGAPVVDKVSWVYFGLGTWAGGFEVKDPADTFFDPKTGPFGTMNINYYKSERVGDYRKCYVYTPAEYDHHPDKNYPVLYLLHDLGEDESAWLYQGVINTILDNAVNDGEVLPMLVVLDNINAYKRIDGKLILPNLVDSVIGSELVPFIDKNYHTLGTSEYRAIGGCSKGGEIAMEIALHFRNLYSSLGVFSLPADFDTSQALVDRVDAAGFHLFWLGAGEGDASYPEVSTFHEMLAENGINHTWDVQSGSANWLAWRKNLLNMAKNLFK
jgi:enterochelin esterase family protein